MRVAIACYDFGATTNTFVRHHAKRLPADVTVINGAFPVIFGQSRFLSGLSTISLLPTAIGCQSHGFDIRNTIVTAGYLRAFKQSMPDVVLAEYGPTAVLAMDACRKLKLPLVAHFHGYDASRHVTIKKHKDIYPELFDYASAVVGVSSDMCSRLVQLGAEQEKVHHIVYGIDADKFQCKPRDTGATFLAVGRLTPKKAPDTTIRAFAEVARACPEAKLVMIGDGPLMQMCQDLVTTLKLRHCIHLRGKKSHEQVCEAMNEASIFVQHSVEADDGDREGTPVAILEAGACGLPIVATTHGGIPDVIINEKSGLLVDEHDQKAMSRAMIRLLKDTDLRIRLGKSIAARVRAEFKSTDSIDKLFQLLKRAST